MKTNPYTTVEMVTGLDIFYILKPT